MRRSDAWAETTRVPCVEALGTAFKSRRTALGLSQRELGAASGIQPRALSQLETGRDTDIPVAVAIRLAEALRLDIELRPHGSMFTPRRPVLVDELGLSPRTVSAFERAGLTCIAELESASVLLRLPGLESGVELYELICALSRYGLSLRGRVPGERERTMFRLRVIDGLTLAEVGRYLGLESERVRQLLSGYFGLSGTPPAAKRRRKSMKRHRNGVWC